MVNIAYGMGKNSVLPVWRVFDTASMVARLAEEGNGIVGALKMPTAFIKEVDLYFCATLVCGFITNSEADNFRSAVNAKTFGFAKVRR